MKNVNEINNDLKFFKKCSIVVLFFAIISFLYNVFVYIIPNNKYTLEYLFNKEGYSICIAYITEKNIEKRGDAYIRVTGTYDGQKFEGLIAQRLFDKIGDEVEVIIKGKNIGRRSLVLLLKADRFYYPGYFHVLFFLIIYFFFLYFYRYNKFLLKDYSTVFCKAEHIKYQTTLIGKKMMYKVSGEYKDDRGRCYRYKSRWIVGIVDNNKDVFVEIRYLNKRPKRYYTFVLDEEPMNCDNLILYNKKSDN